MSVKELIDSQNLSININKITSGTHTISPINYPDNIFCKGVTTYNSALVTLDSFGISGGVILQTYGGGVSKFLIPTANYLFGQYPTLLVSQCLQFQIINNTASDLIIDTVDFSHITFNGTTATKIISAYTSRIVNLIFNGSYLNPTYSLYF